MLLLYWFEVLFESRVKKEHFNKRLHNLQRKCKKPRTRTYAHISTCTHTHTNWMTFLWLLHDMPNLTCASTVQLLIGEKWPAEKQLQVLNGIHDLFFSLGLRKKANPRHSNEWAEWNRRRTGWGSKCCFGSGTGSDNDLPIHMLMNTCATDALKRVLCCASVLLSYPSNDFFYMQTVYKWGHKIWKLRCLMRFFCILVT